MNPIDVSIQPLRHLKHVGFPPRILALPHVDTAQRIYNVYSLFVTEGNLLVDSAREGRKNAVEYLIRNGCRDSELVCDAFVRAAEFGRTNVVRFLYETGLISSDAFRKVCDCVNTLSRRFETLLYLYGFKHASPQMINQWFERVRDMSVLNMVYENEAISITSIVTAFNKAARCVSEEDIHIVKFLCQDNSIASDSIDNAFVCAVAKRQTNVIELLRDDLRLTSHGVDRGFVKAVQNGKQKMVQTLYSQHNISPSGLLRVYERALIDESIGMIKLVVNYLPAGNVRRIFKLKAFMWAAKCRDTTALEILLDSESGDWPIDELENALRVVWHSTVQNLIRKTICDQLYSGRPQQVRASAEDGHQIKTLEWTKDE